MKILANMFRYKNYIITGSVFVVSIIFVFFFVDKLPLNFDEAYNLQVPVSLLQGQGYNTINEHVPFDGFITITTGPTVLVPTFLAFKFLGMGVFQARLIQFLYVTALLVLFGILSSQYYHYAIAASLPLFIFSIQNFSEYGISVLGELPAMFFFFAGMVILSYKNGRYKKIAIFIMGFSVLTKLYFMYVIFSIVLVETVQFLKTKGGFVTCFKELFWLCILFFFPLAFWEAVKFLYLGMEAYQLYLQGFFKIASLQQNTSNAIFTLFSGDFSAALERFKLICNGIFPELPVAITSMMFVGFFFRFVWIVFQKNHLDEKSTVLLFSMLIVFTYLLWFLFISSLGWWRHFFPFSLLTIFLLGDLVHFFITSAKERRWLSRFVWVLCGMGFYFYVIPPFLHQYNSLQKISSSNGLVAQRAFSNQVLNYYERGYKIGVYGWWKAPEICFLAGGIKFTQFNSCPDENKRTIMIYTKLHEILDPQGAASLRSCLGQKLTESQDGMYFLYAVSNDQSERSN